MSIASNIKKLKQEIDTLQSVYKQTKPITIVAVSKKVSVEAIEEAIAAGINNFGENYVQEAVEKWSLLAPKYNNVKVHLIGGLQSNKIKAALNVFNIIETIDRPSLIDKITTTYANNLANKEFYIEVNLAEEENRSGVALQNLAELLKYAVHKKLPITGLMGIAPVNQSNILKSFELLKHAQQYFKLPIISMGMSNDYEQAIQCGTTQVRIGSKIFGARS